MLVRHFMTREVFTVAPDATCFAVHAELVRRRIRRAPVVEGGRLAGIVSMSDLLRQLVFTPGLLDTDAGRHSGETPVHLVMSANVKTVAPNDHLEVAARLMLVERIGAVVAVEEARVAGILTESDVFRALWGMLRRPGARRITLELSPQAARAEPDFAALALRHGCRLRALLECPRDDGGRLVDLVVEGGRADALVAALWQLPATVLSV